MYTIGTTTLSNERHFPKKKVQQVQVYELLLPEN